MFELVHDCKWLAHKWPFDGVNDPHIKYDIDLHAVHLHKVLINDHYRMVPLHHNAVTLVDLVHHDVHRLVNDLCFGNHLTHQSFVELNWIVKVSDKKQIFSF